MDRRKFLQASSLLHATLLGTAGCASGGPVTSDPAGVEPDLSPALDTGGQAFQHGIASGDPQTDRVILWTRVSPPVSLPASIEVGWWIGTSRQRTSAVREGRIAATPARDYTVKVDVGGLKPDTIYYFGFSTGTQESRTGRTRTLPGHGVEEVRFAVTSCANYPQGYFNAYRDIAATEDLHAVLSLGDYLYEYANTEYGNGEPLNRVPEPDREIVSLADYRTRHAQYKTDADLKDAHAQHPWIVIWDDHESTNNSWSGGAQNHNPELGEGDWYVRRAAAIKAYYEWMPIREVPTGLFRSFRFGDLVDLVMLDTRLEGRDEQGTREDLALANQPDRSLLGPVQEKLFLDHLSATQAAKVPWKLVGQQVVFAPWTDGESAFNPDSWDGYRAARARVLDHIEKQQIENVVILTGDVHSGWGMEVHNDDATESYAIELVAPAVSSPPLASTSAAMQDLVARARSEFEHVKYADGLHNGYLSVAISAEQAIASWHATGDRTQRDAAFVVETLVCDVGTNRLTKS